MYLNLKLHISFSTWNLISHIKAKMLLLKGQVKNYNFAHVPYYAELHKSVLHKIAILSRL